MSAYLDIYEGTVRTVPSLLINLYAVMYTLEKILMID